GEPRGGGPRGDRTDAPGNAAVLRLAAHRGSIQPGPLLLGERSPRGPRRGGWYRRPRLLRRSLLGRQHRGRPLPPRGLSARTRERVSGNRPLPAAYRGPRNRPQQRRGRAAARDGGVLAL